MYRLAVLLIAVVAALPVRAQESDSLAIYRNELALVTSERAVELQSGSRELSLDGIVPGIVPDSLNVAGEAIAVVEQRLSPWPLDRRALLTAFLGRDVTLVQPGPDDDEEVRRSATILSVEGGLVVETEDGIAVDPPGRILFPELPAGLSPAPAADLRLRVAEGGADALTLRYLTKGLSWEASYVARWDDAAGTLAITGMADVTNTLSRPVPAASVTLVAGEVAVSRKEQPPQPRAEMRAMTAAASADARGMPTPETRADLKLYALDGAMILPPGRTVQRPLLRADGVAAERRYRIDGLATAWPHRGEAETAAQFRLVIPDTRAAGLEQALPAGTLRVYDGQVFRGALDIADTPLGTELELDLGTAFDVTAAARQIDYERLGDDTYEMAQAVTVKNAKDMAVTARVVGAFPPEWDMVDESHPHEREAAQQPVWTLNVPANGATELTYRVRVRR